MDNAERYQQAYNLGYKDREVAELSFKRSKSPEYDRLRIIESHRRTLMPKATDEQEPWNAGWTAKSYEIRRSNAN